MGDDDIDDTNPISVALLTLQAQQKAWKRSFTLSTPLQASMGSQMSTWSKFAEEMNRTALSILCENVKLDGYGSLRWGDLYLKQMTESLVLGKYRKITLLNVTHNFDVGQNIAYVNVHYSTNGINALKQTFSVEKVYFYGVLVKRDALDKVFVVENGSQYDYDLLTALLVHERPELVPEKFLREDDWLNFRDCSESIVSSYDGGRLDEGVLLFMLRVMCLGYKPTISVEIPVDIVVDEHDEHEEAEEDKEDEEDEEDEEGDRL